MATAEKLKADDSSVTLSVRSNKGTVDYVWFMWNGAATLLVETWQRKSKDKLVEWKASVDTEGIESADLKGEFLL